MTVHDYAIACRGNARLRLDLSPLTWGVLGDILNHASDDELVHVCALLWASLVARVNHVAVALPEQMPGSGLLFSLTDRLLSNSVRSRMCFLDSSGADERVAEE